VKRVWTRGGPRAQARAFLTLRRINDRKQNCPPTVKRERRSGTLGPGAGLSSPTVKREQERGQHSSPTVKREQGEKSSMRLIVSLSHTGRHIPGLYLRYTHREAYTRVIQHITHREAYTRVIPPLYTGRLYTRVIPPFVGREAIYPGYTTVCR